MIFFSNSLWSDSDSFNCEGSKETVKFVQSINLGLTLILFVFVFVGEYYYRLDVTFFLIFYIYNKGKYIL